MTTPDTNVGREQYVTLAMIERIAREYAEFSRIGAPLNASQCFTNLADHIATLRTPTSDKYAMAGEVGPLTAAALISAELSTPTSARGEDAKPCSPWRPMNEIPDSDDLFWFLRGDTVDGPRQTAFDDADYWDWFAPCEAPATATPAAVAQPLSPEFDRVVNHPDLLDNPASQPKATRDAQGDAVTRWDCFIDAQGRIDDREQEDGCYVLYSDHVAHLATLNAAWLEHFEAGEWTPDGQGLAALSKPEDGVRVDDAMVERFAVRFMQARSIGMHRAWESLTEETRDDYRKAFRVGLQAALATPQDQGRECEDCARNPGLCDTHDGGPFDGMTKAQARYLADMEDSLRQLHGIVGLDSSNPNTDALIAKVRQLHGNAQEGGEAVAWVYSYKDGCDGFARHLSFKDPAEMSNSDRLQWSPLYLMGGVGEANG